MKNLEGAVIIITGAAQGIGAACAREFDRRGARLSLLDMTPFKLEGLSHRPLITVGDITDASVRAALLARTLQTFGRVDVLVNNAGVGLYDTALGSDLGLTKRMFDVNVFAPLALSQITAPHFARQRSGMIVNIGSIAGEVALPWAALYCASKSALHSISDSLRRELRTCGVRVITVLPGIVRTNFRAHVLGGRAPEKVESIRNTVAPEDLARAIAAKMAGRGSVLYYPRIGRVFQAADYLLTGILDRYIESRWERRDPALERNSAVAS